MLAQGDKNADQKLTKEEMSGLVNEDEQGRAMEGVLGLQIHTGPPMTLQFRNLLFKKL